MTKGDITKKQIADAFKKLMEVKSFENITVTDITEACDLNRLTFYYHFDDKYALLNWIYYNEIILSFKNNLNQVSWTDNLKTALKTIKKDGLYYRNALAYDNNEFRRYMHEAVIELFMGIVNEWADDKYIDEEDNKFISTFFAYGIVGMVIDWVEKDMVESPESMIEHLQNLVEDIKLMAISRYLRSTFEQK
ncbi:MAG: TetR/AcrR family transcriptional regulator C-terminal domain-containing protein [Eubacteriaceae bacterium]|nr:TetR/AcrR family transcriptional regulator C-terminal domain-containing protein [Eubacteriaceae bacterium]